MLDSDMPCTHEVNLMRETGNLGTIDKFSVCLRMRRKEIGGRLLRRPWPEDLAASVVGFCTAAYNHGRAGQSQRDAADMTPST